MVFQDPPNVRFHVPWWEGRKQTEFEDITFSGTLGGRPKKGYTSLLSDRLRCWRVLGMQARSCGFTRFGAPKFDMSELGKPCSRQLGDSQTTLSYLQPPPKTNKTTNTPMQATHILFQQKQLRIPSPHTDFPLNCSAHLLKPLPIPTFQEIVQRIC